MMKRILNICMLCLCQIVLFAQSGGGSDFDPTNPPDPDSHLRKYVLTLVSSPSTAGYFNYSSGQKFQAGNQLWLRAYTRNGYVFDHWMSADTIVSEKQSFYFTMPDQNVTLTAVYHYDPSSPGDPESAEDKYTVMLESVPAGAGSFSWNYTTKVTAGQQCDIYAYNNNSYTFREWQLDGKQVSTDRSYQFQMPAGNVHLVAVFDFNPTNPENPNKNYWNAETGEVIVDDFTAGNLYDAIYYTTDGNYNKVQMITVAGPVSQYDWGVVNNYSNCTLLDMSRTYGMTYVPSWNFGDNRTLTTIVLPSSIEYIDYCAFYGCSNLSSISIYAATPPTIGDNAFWGIGDSIVYVPADALALYQEAEGWKDFTILPLAKEVSSLEVNLPDGTDPSIYNDMYIELINTKSGQKQRYVVTNRLTYTFNSLVHRTSYNVYLKNRQGDVLGEIDGIDIVDHDVSVTFSQLLMPRDVTLTVLTPEGQDVTQQTTITWMDHKDTYLTKGNMLASQMEGAQVKYRITLPQALAMLYVLPLDSLYEVQANNDISYTLEAIPQKTIGGKVADIKSGRGLKGATVTVSQLLNGLYTKAFTAKTDIKGEWQLTVYDVKSEITASMADYVSKSLTIDSLVTEIPAFKLKDINGTSISLNLTYTNTEGETQTFYNDYANVAFSVYDATAQCAISEMNVQYPQIVLMEQLPAGTQLQVTATSKTQRFMPVVNTATVDELDCAEVTLPIKQLGGIAASYRQTDNNGVVGILYDSNGRLIKKYDYASSQLTISELQDGNYTLVTMANSQLFNSVATVSQFAENGLKEGVDYVKNRVSVKSGAYTTINNALIPYLDETKLYYTGNNTSLTVNKTQVTVGNYLTITGRIDFKSAYADAVSDVKLIVDLPQQTSFVDNSVMTGSSIGSYTYTDHKLIIPLQNYNDRVRFCFMPTEGGTYSPSASVQFTMGDKEITQPIGNVSFTAKNLSISVPALVAQKTVPVSGTAVGKSAIEIYDNGVYVGQATSIANGSWATTIELDNPYNLSKHEIYAKVRTPQGVEMLSESKTTTYNMNAIEAKTVTMSFYNGWLKKNIKVVFDVQDKRIDATSYMFYTTTDITFVADLTNNDPTLVNGVTIRVYTDRNNWKNLKANYDKKTGKWVAVRSFTSSELPIGVKVKVNALTEARVDERLLDDIYDFAKDEIKEYSDFVTECNDTIAKVATQLETPTSIDVNKILQQYAAIVGTLETDDDAEDAKYQYLESLNETALIAYADSLIAALDKEYAENMGEMEGFSVDDLINDSKYGVINLDEEGIHNLKTEAFTNINVEELLSNGYTELNTVGGSKLYFKAIDDMVDMYDCTKNIHISYENKELASAAKLFLKSHRAAADWVTIINNAVNILAKIEEKHNLIKKWIDSRVAQNNKAIGYLRGSTTKICKEFSPLAKLYQKYGFPSLGERLSTLNARVGTYAANIKKLTANSKILNGLKSVGKGLTRGLNISQLLIDGYQSVTDMRDWLSLRNDLEAKVEKCENYRELYNTLLLQGRSVLIGYVSLLGLDLISVAAAYSSVVSGGISLTVTVASSAASTVGGIMLPRQSENYKRNIRATIPYIKKCQDDDDDNDPPHPTIDPIHDPSGYVYEGVASNRLQGVTATAYYKEMVEDMYGDLHENVVLWNAEDYAQENPLFTDEYGMYQWDVPQGLWQVKFEKEGYQTTYSDWLPVPPPQLDVNIPMTQMLQPTVKSGKAYSEGVEIEFDKYMDPSTLTTSNIMLTKNGNAVSGTIELLNEEVTYEGKTETFASKVRFTVPEGEELLSTDEVQLTVKKAVMSYAGMQMQDDYVQKFDVEPRVRLMAVDSLINVGYGAERTITVAALPADASKGKKVNVKSLSTMIAAVNSEELTLDENGQAELKVSGELPGSTVLSYTMEDSDVEGLTIVNVKDAALLVTIAPRASRVSGTEVYRGTKVQLSSETEGAVIYYTLDGSSPSNTAAAIKYDVDAPIVINDDNVTIKAIAQGHDLAESEVAEFNYSLKTTTLGYTLPVGWTWISHNEETAVPVTEFQTGAERIVSQTQEQVNDPVAGFIGNLTELQPVVGYKVKQATEGNVRLSGYEWDATKQAVAVETGWNWIGYPVNQIMTVAEALAFFTPSEGDYLVGQNGFVEYADGEWKGTLEGMKPGEGFLYKSGAATEIPFNTTIVSTAGNRAFKRSVLVGSPWAANSRTYPNIMPMTAQLYDNGIRTSDGEYIVGAFVGTECRGVGQWKEGRLMMNINGTGGEELSFMAYNPQTEQMFNINETFKFTADNQGSWYQPCMLTIGSETTGISISNLSGDFAVTPLVARDHITVTAGGNDINYLTLTDMSGRIVTSLRDLGTGATVTISTLPEGVYIVTAQAGGQTHYRKIVKSKN